MESLLITLGGMLEASTGLAIVSAFLWGILSILLSPCHIGSIPLIVGFLSTKENLTFRGALWISTLFALGILVTIILIGGITAGLGRLLGDIGPWGTYIAAAMFILIGLQLLKVIPDFNLSAVNIRYRPKSTLAAFGIGLIYGLALGPCSFSFMAPMLAMTFASSASNPVFGATLLGVFGIGHCATIAIAGATVGGVQRYLNWGTGSRGWAYFRKICGLIVVIFGIYLIKIGMGQ